MCFKESVGAGRLAEMEEIGERSGQSVENVSIKLSNDILSEICQFLDTGSLLAFCMSCKQGVQIICQIVLSSHLPMYSLPDLDLNFLKNKIIHQANYSYCGE